MLKKGELSFYIYSGFGLFSNSTRLFLYLHFFVAMQRYFSSSCPHKIQVKQNLLSVLNSLNSVVPRTVKYCNFLESNLKVTAIVRFFGGILNTLFFTLEESV